MTTIVQDEWRLRVLHADFRVREAMAELFINDVPVSRVRSGPIAEPGSAGDLPQRECVPIQQVLVPGDNVLRVELSPAEPPAALSADAAATAEIAWFSDGEFQNAQTGGTTLVGLRVPSGSTSAEDASTTFARLEVSSALGPPAFVRAERLDVTAALLDEAEHVVRAYASAVEQGDASRLAPLIEMFCADHVRAYPTMQRATLDRMHEGFLRAFQGGTVEVAARSSWAPRLVGGARLLDLRRRDGAPVLVQHQPDGVSLAIPMMIGWVEGRVLIMR